ncbi:KAP family NTPase [Colwellia sp. 20A7]|uniref:KAP family NTPase n=1 Tax=Colwellia sp. 20A7 TaxID=2689569 RepID=UPI00135C06E3|nr:KAP family NTPase [Colwellia sp. 20A7]
MMEYTFKNRDEFLRKPIAEKIIKLLSSDIDVSPMMLDGDWGTGKTEFCLKTIELIKESDLHQVIYVDGFKADHANEPLLTILAEILKLIPEGKQSSFIKKIIPAARYSVKTLLKAGVGHILRQDFADTADGLDKEIQKATDKAIDSSVESLIKENVKAEENLEALKSALKELAVEKPIIIFIDELDRCRPDFAVSMLEIIKHVFDVKGVQFILVTNSHQLKASINHCYGNNVVAQRYLDKFLRFSFQLSVKSKRNQTNSHFASITLYQKSIQSDPSLNQSGLLDNIVLGFVETFIKNHKVSLREVETFIRHLTILQILSEGRAFENNQCFGHTLINLLGVLIHCFKPDLISSINHLKYDALEIGQFLHVKDINSFPSGHNQPAVEEILMVIIARDCNLRTKYLLPEKDDEKWKQFINKNYFHFPIQSGDAIKKLSCIFEVLSLSNDFS